jgi:hypothetical protein
MYLCTGSPSTTTQDDRIIVSIPSGQMIVQIALTPHQALMLATKVGRDADAFVEEARKSASLISFRGKKRRAGR